MHSLFVVQHQAVERDEKRKKTPFGMNKPAIREEPMGALQQLIVNQFSPIALGKADPGRVVSSRFWWHFPASRAMIFVCLQGTITLHAPGFRDITLVAPEAAVLPGALWHQALFTGTVPQTLTMIY